MSVPHLVVPRPPLENEVGDKSSPKTAVPRPPLLCAPYRAQRWGTGDTMGNKNPVPQPCPPNQTWDGRTGPSGGF